MRGIVPIVLTPFDADGNIAWASLEREVLELNRYAINGIGIGFGSEITKLTEPERVNVTKTVVSTSADELSVVVSVGAESTYATLQRCADAQSSGADIFMLCPPAGIGPRGLIRLVDDIAERFSCEIMLQDAAAVTGTGLAAETIIAVASHCASVTSVKVESPPTASKVSEVAPNIREGVTVLGGGGGIAAWQELTRGADGIVPGPAFINEWCELWRAYHSGERDLAQRIYASLLPFLVVATQSLSVFHMAQKYVLWQDGVLANDRVRAPGPLDADAVRRDVDEAVRIVQRQRMQMP